MSGYLNMDALEEHLREMVKLEVADYTRDILPIIVVSTTSGGGGAAAAAAAVLQLQIFDDVDGDES